MTSGDVQAVVWAVLATCGTLWAALVAGSLLFSERARRAQFALTQSTARTLWTGAFSVGTAGIVGLVLVNQPNGLLKFVGYIVSLGLFGVALLGSCGLAMVAAERLHAGNERVSWFGAVARGAGFLIAAGMVPIIGWFLLMPLAFIASVGAGFRAVLRRNPEAALASSPTPANIETGA